MNQKAKKILQLEYYSRLLSRRDYSEFIRYTNKKYMMTDFHKSCINIMQAFIDSRIKKLILTIPPQHGKSEISTRRLAPFLFGLDPSLRIAVVSYSTDRARRFGRDIKRIMTGKEYKDLFPLTRIPDEQDRRYVNTSDIVDVIGPEGSGNLFLVGRGGGLTGDTVDVLIMDDMYKNSAEANSPIIRQTIIDWYDLVGDSRLHNDSRQLIVFTRWHDADLVGYIKKNHDIITIKNHKQIERANPEKWYMINFQALKDSEKTEYDNREIGQALFPEKHKRKKLEETRERLMKTNPENWLSLYQGDPRPATGLLYGSGFNEYTKIPELTERKAYIDTADEGDNMLCAICYGIGIDNYIYILDVYYTIEPAEQTEPGTAEILIRNKVDECIIESNAGGRAFARNVEKLLIEKRKTITITPYYQKQNKESRIVTNAASIMRSVLFPEGWASKWPIFYEAITGFRKLYSANKLKDAPDALTGVYEHSGMADVDDDIFTAIV